MTRAEAADGDAILAIQEPEAAFPYQGGIA